MEDNGFRLRYQLRFGVFMVGTILKALLEKNMALFVLSFLLGIFQVLCALAFVGIINGAAAEPFSVMTQVCAVGLVLIVLDAGFLVYLEYVVFPSKIKSEVSAQTIALTAEKTQAESDKKKAESDRNEAKEQQEKVGEEATAAHTEAFVLRQCAEEAGNKIGWTLQHNANNVTLPWKWNKNEVPPDPKA